jgi:uncharacterized repeat protein (TIGR03803 family)
MKSIKGCIVHDSSHTARATAIGVIAFIMFAAQLHAQGKATLLHVFTGGSDGSYPTASLTADGAGNLYGTTQTGGTYGNGTVFELSPESGGHWQFSVLHEFTGGNDGGSPLGSLVFDADGNAYLTVSSGGVHGLGAVIELNPPEGRAPSAWKAKLLYSFQGGTDGSTPFGNVVFDSAGNLYGTTSIGGHSHINCLQGCGTIYRLTQTGGGAWREQVLHRFLDAFNEGALPRTGLVFDANGNLYGTTYQGGDPGCGANACGTVFEFGLDAQGEPHLQTLLAFSGPDGAFPLAGVTLDGKGNLYTAATFGGSYNEGTVISMTDATGPWKLASLYSFNGLDGLQPSGTLALDTSGNLYGTGYEGGANDWGALFELMPAGETWTENLLFSFAVSGVGLGANPLDGVLLDGAGNLYLTTNQGGNLNYCEPNSGCGTVVEFSAQ